MLSKMIMGLKNKNMQIEGENLFENKNLCEVFKPSAQIKFN